jgi:hypothetical protein
MKQLSIALITILMSCMTFSQSSKDLNIRISSGISIPLSSNNFSDNYSMPTKLLFSDNWKTGFNIGLGIGYIITPEISALLDVHYNVFHLDKVQMLKSMGLSGDQYVDDADLSVVHVNASVKYSIMQDQKYFNPYVLAGIGMMSIAGEDIYILLDAYHNATYRTLNKNVFDSSFGIGVDFLGSESSSFFVEVKSTVGFTKKGTFYYLPISVGFQGTF